jgi:predicted PurR-regulated permease PerM
LATQEGKRELSMGIDANSPRTTTETIVLVVAVLLLIALGYSILPIVSPFLITGALIYLLYPFRKDALAGRILSLALILFLIWFFSSVLGLLAPFILAYLLAYMLDPLVVALERRTVPRWLSSLVIVVLLLSVASTVMLFVMPRVVQQFNEILSGLTRLALDIAEFLKSGQVVNVLAGYGIPVEEAREAITTQLSPRLQGILTGLFEGILGVLSSFSSIVLHIINAVILPFLLFYLLKDFPLIAERVKSFVPERRRDQFIVLTRRVDELIGRYLRGAVVVAIIQGVTAGVALWMIGVKYALVLGIMTGLLDFIPYVGLLVSLVVSSIVALLSGGNVAIKVVAVIVLYLLQKLLEGTVLAPKIIGGQVGLHPLLLILCLLIFGFFLGFVGLLIAVPVTALLMAGLKEWEARRSAPEVPRA